MTANEALVMGKMIGTIIRLEAFWKNRLSEKDWATFLAGANEGTAFLFSPEYATIVRMLLELKKDGMKIYEVTLREPKPCDPEGGLTQGQRRMGLRSTRHVSGKPWNSDVD